MPRSIKKGAFVDEHLMNKILTQPPSAKFLTWQRMAFSAIKLPSSAAMV